MLFPAFRSLMLSLMQRPDAAKPCETGLLKSSVAPTIDDLCIIVRANWFELSTRLWPAFHDALQEAKKHPEFFTRLRANGVFYNQPTQAGFAIVDDDAPEYIVLGGVARAVVRGKAAVSVEGNAHVYLYDDACADASGAAYIECYDHAHINVSGRNTVMAHDDASVHSDSHSTIYLYDRAVAEIIRTYRVYNHSQL